MKTFFNILSQDAQQLIYDKLPPKTLFTIASTGNKTIRALAWKALFQNTSSQAIRYQQQLLSLWQINLSEFLPSDKIVLKAISSLKVSNKLPGLLAVINRKRITAPPNIPSPPLLQTQYVESLLQNMISLTYTASSFVRLNKLIHCLSAAQLEQCLTVIINTMGKIMRLTPTDYYGLLKHMVKIINPEQQSRLLAAVLQAIQSGSDEAEQALKVFAIMAPELTSAQCFTVFEAAEPMYKKKKYAEFIREFPSLISYMSETQLGLLLTEVQSYLSNEKVSEQKKGSHLMLQIAPYLTRKQLQPLMVILLSQFRNETDSIRAWAAKELTELLSVMTDEEIKELVNHHIESAKATDEFNHLEKIIHRVTAQQATDAIELIINYLTKNKSYRNLSAIKCFEQAIHHLNEQELTLLHTKILSLAEQYQHKWDAAGSNFNTLLQSLIIQHPVPCANLTLEHLLAKQPEHYHEHIAISERVLPILSAEQLFLIIEEAKKNLIDETTHKFLQNNAALISLKQTTELVAVLVELLSDENKTTVNMAWGTLKFLLNSHEVTRVPTQLFTKIGSMRPENLVEFLDLINIIAKVAVHMPAHDLNSIVNLLIKLYNSEHAEVSIVLFNLSAHLSEEQQTLLLPSLLRLLQEQQFYLRHHARIMLDQILPSLSTSHRDLVLSTIKADLESTDGTPHSQVLPNLGLLIKHTLCDDNDIHFFIELLALTDYSEETYFKEKHKKDGLLQCLAALANTPLILAQSINYLTQITNDDRLPSLIRQRSLDVLSSWTIRLLIEPEQYSEQLKIVLNTIDYPAETIPLSRLAYEDTDEYIELQLLGSLCRSYYNPSLVNDKQQDEFVFLTP